MFSMLPKIKDGIFNDNKTGMQFTPERYTCQLLLLCHISLIPLTIASFIGILVQVTRYRLHYIEIKRMPCFNLQGYVGTGSLLRW